MVKKLWMVAGLAMFFVCSISNAENYESTQKQNTGQGYQSQGQFRQGYHPRKPFQGGMMDDPMIKRNPQMMQLQQQIMLDLQQVRADRDRLNQSMMRLQQHRMQMMKLRQELMKQKQMGGQPYMNQKPGMQNEQMRVRMQNKEQMMKQHNRNQPTIKPNESNSGYSSGGNQ